MAGLRERKKERTREHIAETARTLFAERGFERVTVAEIARGADVSEPTVFNYFPRKEDLVFWRLGSFEEELLSAIRARPAGEPVAAAFGRFVLVQRGLLGRADPDARARLTGIARTIAESAALLAREREIFAGYTDSLAALIAQEQGARPGDLRPWIAANALMGAHRALVDHARRRVLEGARAPGLTREVRQRAEQVLALLADGLGDYAPAP